LKLLLVHHLVDLPGWEGIADRQVGLLERSGLLDALDEAHFLAHYDGRSFDGLRRRLAGRGNVRWGFDPRVEPREGEVPSIASLRSLADSADADMAIGYIHMKGVSRPDDEAVRDWARFMEYWIVERWRDCVAALEAGRDSCGVNFRFRPWPHYVGNFWWARASYVRTLLRLRRPSEVRFAPQVPGQEWDARYDAEAWVLSGTGRHLSLDTSPVRYGPAWHYENRFPPEAYRGRPGPRFAFTTREGRLSRTSRLRWSFAKRFQPGRRPPAGP